MNCVTCSQQYCFCTAGHQTVLRGTAFIIPGSESRLAVCVRENENGKFTQKMCLWLMHCLSRARVTKPSMQAYKPQYFFVDKYLATVQLSVHEKSEKVSRVSTSVVVWMLMDTAPCFYNTTECVLIDIRKKKQHHSNHR